jgi:SAM-dependent methyltransferase
MLGQRWLEPILSLAKFKLGLREYFNYWRSWRAYSKLPAAESLLMSDAYPCLFDRSANTPYDAHYFYQDIWAFKLIKESATSSHVDVGSLVSFVGFLTAVTEVTFVDIRPLKTNLQNLTSRPGSILALPFEDQSLPSLSCLHAAEHIGLGRYGDSLDPQGTKKAARELARVLAPQGNLYFSVPIGKPRVCFNAHRIHSPKQILSYFHDLELVEFAAVTDTGTFVTGIRPDDLAGANYACGLFRFTKVSGAERGKTRGD